MVSIVRSLDFTGYKPQRCLKGIGSKENTCWTLPKKIQIFSILSFMHTQNIAQPFFPHTSVDNISVGSPIFYQHTQGASLGLASFPAGLDIKYGRIRFDKLYLTPSVSTVTYRDL